MIAQGVTMQHRRILCGLVLLIALCALAPASAADKPADLIVGKWQGEVTHEIAKFGEKPKKYTAKVFLEFAKDGKLKSVTEAVPDVPAFPEETLTGTYKFVSETELEVAVKMKDPRTGKEEETKVRLKVAVTKDELTMTAAQEGAKPQKLKRAK
jgi:uncharacterized protein (TIGR03066 family)